MLTTFFLGVDSGLYFLERGLNPVLGLDRERMFSFVLTSFTVGFADGAATKYSPQLASSVLQSLAGVGEG